MTTTRRLAAILAADVAGYSAMMATDEVGTLTALKAVRREVVDPAIAEHRGRIVKTTGDGMLVEFASAVDAVTCAMSVQEKMAERGGNLTFRIGINVGDIIIDGDDIFGDGVNIAARLENECAPGGVYLSDDAFRQVRAKTSFAFDDLGEKPLKNIDRPIRIYATRMTGAVSTNVLPEPSKPLPLPDKPSIAVLPFQNMSGDPEQEYFADGMVEDIITALSRFNSLFVIARNSSFTYKGKTLEIKRVGRELGVRYVLEGSVRKAGNRVRITAQLIEAETGSHLWADKFDGALEDIFDLQDNVAADVVARIAPRVYQAEHERLERKSPESWTGYDHYLRGRALRTDRKYPEAMLELNKAISLEPGFGPAYAEMALCAQTASTALYKPISAAERAEAIRLTDLSVRLASNDASVAVCAVFVYATLKNDYAQAIQLAERAVELNPNLASAWSARGWANNWRGEPAAGLQDFARGLRLNPLDPAMIRSCSNGSAMSCLFLGRYAEGEIWAKKALALNPSEITPLGILTFHYRLAGRLTEANETSATLRRLHPTLRKSHIIQTTRHYQRPEHQAMFDQAIELLDLPE